MLRYIALAGTACLLYFRPEPSTFVSSPALLRFLEEHRDTIHSALKYALVVWGPLEVNAALSRWAENRWQWKSDKRSWHWPSEIAVVTGGSRGIGAVVVKELVKLGIKVAVLDLVPLEDGLEKDESNLVHFYQCDITSKDTVHQAGEAIRTDIGNPSILINNAGIGNADTILSISPSALTTIFNVNLLSHWLTVQEFLPSMIAANKGHIMSVASLASFVSFAGAVDYGCTKAGLLAFHEGLNQELKHRYGAPMVKTSIVHPGWTKTRLTGGIEDGIRGSGAGIMEPEFVATAMVKHITACRSGQLILGPKAAPYVRALPMWLQEIVRDRNAKVVTVNAVSTAVGDGKEL